MHIVHIHSYITPLIAFMKLIRNLL